MKPLPRQNVESAAELVELLDALARGDRSSAGKFVDLFEAEVNRLVWTLLGADSEHDDVVHEAFGAMLRGVHQVQSAAALHGWVRTVTVNCVRQELRRRRWRRLFSREEEGLSHPDLRVADEATRERVRSMLRVLNQLGADARVLLLRHVEGYELAELAEATGCSLATVKRRLASAQAALDEKLGGAS